MKGLFVDPRQSTARALAILDYYEEHDGPVPGSAGAFLRCRALASAMRGVLPTDVVSMSVARRELGCGTQCDDCLHRSLDLGDRTVLRPFRWSLCDRAASELDSFLRRTGYQVVLLSDIQLHPYVPIVRERSAAPFVIDLHNAESDLYETLSGQPGWPRVSPWGEARGEGLPGARHLERMLVETADLLTVQSAEDMALLRARYGTATQMSVLPNAVSIDATARPSPGPVEKCVFIGQLHYLPNLTAALEIATTIGPAIEQAVPGLRVVIAGRNPPPDLVEAAGRSTVELVADPPDILPYFQNSIFLAPMTLGGGARLKVLEAFATGAPVVATLTGMAGIDAIPDKHYLLAENAAEFGAAVQRILDDPAEDFRRRERGWELVCAQHSWTSLVTPMRAALELVGC